MDVGICVLNACLGFSFWDLTFGLRKDQFPVPLPTRTPYTSPMFLDQATIDVRGGRGGRGCVGFRREKYIPYGGPNGGNGGRGGDVFLIADDNADTLSDFTSRKRFEAEPGGFGLGKNCNGKDGEDLLLKVPPGTVVSKVVKDENGVDQLIPWGDLSEHGEMLMIAKGGRGGYGNAHFKSSTRQAPDFAELGEPGEQHLIKLDLKLVADIGIIGYPSVGKSTLISVISAARPKIADYPFTTLVPNLGVVSVHDRNFVVCDIPGLIEGASEGKGLGHEFLRHIERCGALLHLLDISRALLEGQEPSSQNLINDYRAIRKELAAYSPTLSKKREIVVLNKSDLLAHDTKKLENALAKEGIEVFMSISSATKNNIDELVKKLFVIVLEERKNRMELKEEQDDEKAKSIPVLRPQERADRMGAYSVEKRKDGIILVKGKRLEQFTVMTNFESEGAVRRFRDVLERIGLLKTIQKLRGTEDSSVYIGNVRVDEHL